MKINDQKMLPKRVLMMENMADLLQSENIVLDQLHDLITEQERQLTISTATTLLSRHEKILGLPTDSDATVEDRRSRIIAKLLGQGTVNRKLLQRVASSFTNGAVEIIEHPSDFSFDLKFVSAIGTPPNMDNLSAALDEIKPAHLVYRYLYRYLLIREIHQVMTLNDMQQQTLDKFAFGGVI